MGIIDTLKSIETKEDDYIYHYTSPDVFAKILENGFYATHTDFLNDDTEVREGEYLASYIVNLLTQKIKNIEISNYWKDLKQNLNKLDVYVTCFTRQPDSLYQWKAYTPKGGFALGFSKNALFETIPLARNQNCSIKKQEDKNLVVSNEDISTNEKLLFFFKKCHYSREKIFQDFFQLFKADITQDPVMLDNKVKNLLKKNGVFDVSVNFRIIPTIKLLFSMTKNPSFKIEDEERLICIGEKTLREKIELIGAKPRIKVPCDIKKLRNALKKVIISPHGNRKRNEIFASLLHDKYKLNFKTKHSSSSSNGE